MGDSIITKDQLIGAGKNADAWEKYWAGSDDENVITRLNKEYPTHAKALKVLMENGGIQPFQTEVELLASVPIVDPTAAKALDTKKVWLWKNLVWLDTGLSEQELAKNYTDKALKFTKGWVNLFNKEDWERNYFYSYETGNKEAASTESLIYGCVRFPIDSNTQYRCSLKYAQVAFYDSELSYISGIPLVENGLFTSPVNTSFIGLTVREWDIDEFMLCKRELFPATYAAYERKIDDLVVFPDQIEGLDKRIDGVVGLEYINIIDTQTVLDGRYIEFATGLVGISPDYVATDFLPVKPNTSYRTTSNNNQQYAFYNVNKIYISGQATAIGGEFTTPTTAVYARFTINKDILDSVMVAESSIFPSSYVPHSMKIAKNILFDETKIEVIVIHTSADTNHPTAEFKGKNAIQRALDSIADASAKKRYQIIDSSVHKIDNAVDYIGQRGYPTAILAKDHVDIIGNGNTVVYAELPYNDADIGTSVDGNTYPRNMYQTLYTYAEDSLIKGITFVQVNGRYALHLDNSNGANKTYRFEDVNFIFKGDKGSVQAIGMGTSTGEEVFFNIGSAHSDVGIPIYLHNNVKFEKSSIVSFENFKISSNVNTNAMLLQSNGSLVKDTFKMIGCSFSGSAYVIFYWQNWLSGNTANNNDSFDHAEWKFTGYGNAPFLFNNVVGGDCLRFSTTATGVNNSIRFDKTSSAFSVLIQNNQGNSDVSLYVNSRDYMDGYIVQDGSIDLPAYAFGCKDLSELKYSLDNNANYTSMGTRLGDCSTATKTLKVIVNSTTNTVTFNKNYTSMTNAQIVSEINSQLSGAVVELYIYGGDYYPMMSDVAEIAYNTGSTFIPYGSVVAKSGGSVRLAQANDKVFGVALDDIPVQITTATGMKKGEGRVLKRGLIYTNPVNKHHVKSDNTNPAVGTRFNVENGRLVTDANGKLCVDIDIGVISINC